MKYATRLLISLLLVAALGVIFRPDPVLAVSPIIQVWMTNPVPGADQTFVDFDGDGQTNDEGSLVETDWGHTGTVLKVRIQSGGLVASDANDTTANVTIESEEADRSIGPILLTERSTGTAATDDGFIQFEIELHPVFSTAGTAPFVGPANRFYIQVDADDEVTVIVEPSGPTTIDVARSITLGVENTNPKIRNVTPESGDVVDDEDVDIEFSITDLGSGIPQPEDKPDSDADDEYSSTAILLSNSQCTESEIYFNIANGEIAAGVYNCAGASSAVNVVAVGDENDFDDITNGFDVDTSIFLKENATHYFTVVTFDAAGNFDVFDGEPSNSNTMAEVAIDTIDPQLHAAFPPRTGVAFDSFELEFIEDREWIQVMVVDASDLDPDSIDKDDFVVEGHTIRRVQWFDVDPEEMIGGPDSGAHATVAGPQDIGGTTPATCYNAAGTATANCNVANAQIPRPDSWFPGADNPRISGAVPDSNGRFMIRNSVFIQLEDEISPAERPDINIVPDGIDDEAGNNVDSDDEQSEDWIAPKFRLESLVTPNSPLRLVGVGQETELIFSSDEDLDGGPIVTVTLVNDVDLNDTSNQLGVDVDEIGTNLWQATIDEPDDTGFYNIYISGDDIEGNAGGLGIPPMDIIHDFFNFSGIINVQEAIYIEADVSLPLPSVSLQDGDEVIVISGVLEVEVDFATPPDGGLFTEDEEYQGDSFADVTITKFEVDGEDRLADIVPVTPAVALSSGGSGGVAFAKVRRSAGGVLMASSEILTLYDDYGMLLEGPIMYMGSPKDLGELNGSDTQGHRAVQLQIPPDTTDPQLNSAFPPRTGVSFDPVAKVFVADRSWLQAIFVDESDLDPSSIDANDFIVEGHSVQSAWWFDIDPDDLFGGPGSFSPKAGGPVDVNGASPASCFNAAGTALVSCDEPNAQIPRPDSWFPGGDNPSISLAVPNGNGIFQIRNSVFIQLTDELDADETPELTIVPDGVDDTAGNTLDSQDEEAADWISPEFTIESIDGPNAPDLLVGEDQEIEIIFTSDEEIDGDPNVVVTLVLDSDLNDVSNTLNTDVDEIGVNRWRVTIDEPNNTGYYNIWITGDDDEGNTGDAGTVDPAGGLSDFFDGGSVSSDAFFFEGDISMAAPRISVDGLELEVEASAFLIEDPFVIQLNFDETATGEVDNEENEYFLDNFGEASIVLIELDTIDVDALGLVTTTDDKEFILTIPAIAVGVHELIVIAADEAGNETFADVSFEIVESVDVEPVNQFLASIAGLTPGPHSLRLNAMDEAGNQLPEDLVLSFNVADTADLMIEMTALPSTVNFGQQLTYTLNVFNYGPASSTATTLTDNLPTGTSFVSAEPFANCNHTSGLVTCNLGSLAMGESAVSTITVTANAAGSVTNSATVQTASDDPNTDNDTATATTTVLSPAPSSSSSGGGGGGGGGLRINPTTSFEPGTLTFFASEGGDNPPPQTIEVWTSRDRSVLRFAVTADVPWIDIDPAEAISDDPGDTEDIEITIDASGLSVGTYTGTITIDGRRATNGDQVISVTLIIEEPVASGRTRAAVNREEDTDFATPDGRVRVVIPAAAAGDSDDRRIQVEVEELDVESVPSPPEDTVFIRAIEIHTIVDGEVAVINYEEPVELSFVLEPEDLDLVDGDTSLLGVLWLNPDTGEWEALPTAYDPDPAPAGKLVAQLDHFSTYAVGVVLPKEEAPAPVATATPEPTATPAPEPTSTAVPEPVKTATAVATATASPATPTAVIVTQTPTPVPTRAPQPTATATPPALAIAVAPAPSATPPPAPELVTLPEEDGGISGTTVAILAVLVIAIVAGGYGVLQAYNRRRPA